MDPPKRFLAIVAVFGMWLTHPHLGRCQTNPGDGIGSVTVQFPSEGFFLFSPVVMSPVQATGVIDSVEGTVLTDLEGDFTNAFPDPDPIPFVIPPPLVLTVLDGPHAGTSLIILLFAKTELTAARELAGLSVVGASYELRWATTLWSLQQTLLNTVASGTGSTADLLWIWDDASGVYRRIYYSSSGIVGVGWREIGKGPADLRFFPIHPWKAIFYQRRNSFLPATNPITFTGVAPTTPLLVPLQYGFNVVSRGTVEPLTLGQSRLEERLNSGVSSIDLVWIQEPDGTYTRYYFSPGGILGAGWRRVGGGAADASNVPLSSGFIIERRGGPPTSVLLPPPPG